MDDFEWNPTNESKLLEAMVGYKPVGINKYFEMACVAEKLIEMEFDIPSDKIWSHLKSMYNLESLDEQEQNPFPNEERDFQLPDAEYGILKSRKEEKIDDKNIFKSNSAKRNDNKDGMKSTPVKDIKKDDKNSNKKDNNQRRDSKDGKDLKPNVIIKKDVKRETLDKSKAMKSRSSSNFKEDDKTKTPNRLEEAKRLNKRPTRASIKPEEPGTPVTRKSQSPLTITPSSINKRRRI